MTISNKTIAAAAKLTLPFAAIAQKIDMPTTFGDRLRQLRLSRNYSQRDLGRLLSISYTYVSKLENGATEHPPKEQLLEQMADLFGVDAEDLTFAAGRIPSAYSGLLSQLAVRYGRSLPGLLEQLLENGNARY